MSATDNCITLQAADPVRNATVHASAGTGKTWLLVTRILRLLLAGARPDSILAVTFTRKAAAEMQQRVTERLRELMCADASSLDRMLAQIGIRPDASSRTRARQLYEQGLFNPYALRATTFHAFCQELLQRFPLEAGIAPGFELSESTGLLEQQAWDALVNESSSKGHPINQALDRLTEACGGLSNTRSALRSFLAHRSDWWAYSQGQSDPLSYATTRLEQLLQIDAGEEPLEHFPDNGLRADLQAFGELLQRNVTPTNTGYAQLLAGALDSSLAAAAFLDAIKAVFLTGEGKPRSRKAGKTQCKRLGEQDEQTYIELHQHLCDILQASIDRLARYNTLHTSVAWITAGMQLLTHYQRIKQEQRLLDFSDLEWKACELLNQSNHASWIQYKLDTRIDHLLVDEFQDTNPTQWRLLQPLLEELAAGNDDRARSVFLVGDKKQSIYSFRRANPALLGEASDWLHENLQAQSYPLDASRRSAQAIVDCVNTVFASGPLTQRLDDFNRHTTYLPDMYGYVELLPLMTSAPAATADETATLLRNPLHAPRIVREDQRYANEARLIASRIQALMQERTAVTKDGVTRALQHSDIIILLRQRIHARAYEQALREMQIPCLSDSKGALLDNLEVHDLECLLNTLISPYDNLALAQVLRSPIIGLSSEQLIPLAAATGATWYERLAGLATAQQPPFADIHAQLEHWRALTGHIPVHDLLDRIFHEAEVLQRYEAAFPAALTPRVHASLTRFIELALEVDNGRYPSLPRFLDQLNRLRQSDNDQPDEGTPEEADAQRVRIMTIHGAKGLEAPVIFLADTASQLRSHNAHGALVDWPENREQPAHFLLTGKKASHDSVTCQLLDEQAHNDQREEANLLYVAITRARQYLFISGNQKDAAAGDSWYGLIQQALAGWDTTAEGHPFRETGSIDVPTATSQPAAVPVTPDPRLSGPLAVEKRQRLIAPSRALHATSMEHGDEDGRERGTAIHLMLQQLSGMEACCPDVIPASIASALQREATDPECRRWWQEAVKTVQAPQLAWLFDHTRCQKAFNEVPIQYRDGDQLVYGIIDRLIINSGTAHVIDYKTHQWADRASLSRLTDLYREQMRLYANGVHKLWPGLSVIPCLLFTACGELVAMDDLVSA
ncbi:MAG: UvrD-helicase domain-containing protein [Gammaproteobacteria bacterium]